MVRSKSAKRFEILAHTVMIFITVCIVLPFILLFMSSITSETALVRDGYSFFPKELSLDAYKFIADNAANVFRAYGITIFVTVVGTAINLAMSALLAYPLSLKNLPGKRFFSFYVFFTMLFNGGLVPTYLMYTGIFHINNTLLAYIIPGFLMSAMNVMPIRTFFANSIPDALFEAAQIDGASQFQIFGKIVLPLGKPILVAMGLLSGLGYWNDWFNAMMYIDNQDWIPLQYLLIKIESSIDWLASNKAMMGVDGIQAAANMPKETIKMAIVVISTLPIIFAYPFFQRYFVNGLTIGAVKE